MKYYIVISLFLCLASCSQTSYEQYFSSNEAAELETLIDSFDKAVTNHYKLSTNEAYTKYAQEIKDYYDENYSIPTNEWNSKLLLKDSDYEMFSEIWWVDPQNKSNINFNTNGKYAEFLESEGKSNEFLGAYYTMLMESGDFHSPVVLQNFVNEYNELNFNNKNHRLIFIIQYLSVLS